MNQSQLPEPNDELIDLGQASVETRGSHGAVPEIVGSQPSAVDFED